MLPLRLCSSSEQSSHAMAVPTVQKTKIEHDYDNAILNECLGAVLEADFDMYRHSAIALSRHTKDPAISRGISPPAGRGVWDLNVCSSRLWSSQVAIF